MSDKNLNVDIIKKLFEDNNYDIGMDMKLSTNGDLDMFSCSIMPKYIKNVNQENLKMRMNKKSVEIEKIIEHLNIHLDIISEDITKLKDEYKLCMPTIPNKLDILKTTINEMMY